MNPIKDWKERRAAKRKAKAKREARAIYNAFLIWVRLRGPIGPDQW